MSPSPPLGMNGGLTVATPERVSLDLPIAGIGHRAMAYLLDFLLLFLCWAALYFAFSLLVSDVLGLFQSLSSAAQTALVLGAFASQWLYWTVSETLPSGQTFGKRVMKVRVTRDDGSPVGLLESAVRNLCRMVDFLPAFYALGMLTALVSRRHRRLGDLLAGTVLLRDDRGDLSRYLIVDALPAPLESASSRALSVDEHELLLAYLERAPLAFAEARLALARALVARYGGDAAAPLDSAEDFLRRRARAEP